MVSNKYNILLVDEDPLNLKTFDEILTAAEFNVYKFDNGKKALSYLNKTNAVIDLIISGLYIPDLTGLRFLKKVKNRSKCYSIPFIFLSEAPNKEIQLKAVEQGAIEFFQRPVDNDIFTAKIYSLLSSFAIIILKNNIVLEGSSSDLSIDDIIYYCEKENINGYAYIYTQTEKATILFNNGVLNEIFVGNVSGSDAYEKIVSWDEYKYLLASGRYIEDILNKYIKIEKMI